MRGKTGGRKGFTLIELIVVIAVLAILIAIAVPSYNGLRESSKSAVCQTNLNEAVRGYAYSTALGQESNALTRIDQVMTEELHATAVTPGNTYTGLCPDGGTTIVSIDNDGNITLTCEKHGGNKATSFASALVTAISTTSRTSSGKVQTLADFLKNKHYVDSTASSSSTSFTNVVTEALKADGITLTDKSWTLYRSGENYIVCVTKNGTISSGSSSVAVTQFTYSVSTGKLVSVTDTTCQSVIPSGTNYYALRPNS